VNEVDEMKRISGILTGFELAMVVTIDEQTHGTMPGVGATRETPRGSGLLGMKKSRFSESQIVNILKEAEAGVSLEELSRQHGFSKATFYKWKAKYSGMDVSTLKRLKELEEENRRLKQMYAELSLDHKVLKDIVEKKL
jgi:putative transposase